MLLCWKKWWATLKEKKNMLKTCCSTNQHVPKKAVDERLVTVVVGWCLLDQWGDD